MFNRMRLVAAAAALLVAAPMASLGTAHAQETAARGDAERTITIKGIEPRDNVFFAKGKVSPDYKNRYAIMQRKLKSANKWDNWRKFKTNSESRYRKEIKALNRTGTICYRVKIKGNDTFATSYSRRVCIKTTRV